MIFPLPTHEILKSWSEAKTTDAPGTTYAAIPGCDILAPCNGRVMLAHWRPGQGRCVNIRGDNWADTVSIRGIWALSALETETVKAGDVLATAAGPVTIIVWHGWWAADPETVWEATT